jgi:hypothetical protein
MASQNITEDELTKDLIDAGDDLFLDDTGNFMTVQKEGDPIAGEWVWGENGLVPFGSAGTLESAITTPFLGIQEKYRGGNPIEAETWQDAVRKSLEGFMRVNYGVDPILKWNEQSGTPGSQFRIGTLQEMIDDPTIGGNFFDTLGLARNVSSGDLVDPSRNHWDPASGVFDPLLGLAPDTKLLGFEDIPFEQVEKLVGGMPGQLLIPTAEHQRIGREMQTTLQEIQRAQTEGSGLNTGGGVFGGLLGGFLGATNIGALQQKYTELKKQYDALPTPWHSLAEARSNGALQDFNDYLFMLDINQNAPPPELVKASPESVLKKFFQLPQYQLAFGDDPNTLDPSLSPTERFRFDPGYQFSIDEGMKQIQRNSAAKGLLESGATQRDLQQFGQGMADQNYQRWVGQNLGLYSDWQNQLRGLMMQGAGLSQNAAQNTLGVGNVLGQQQMQLGSNLGNLFGNQGALGATAFLNTGAAQANTVMNAASLEAQVRAANAAAQNQANAQESSNQASLISGAFGLLGGAF